MYNRQASLHQQGQHWQLFTLQAVRKEVVITTLIGIAFGVFVVPSRSPLMAFPVTRILDWFVFASVQSFHPSMWRWPIASIVLLIVWLLYGYGWNGQEGGGMRPEAPASTVRPALAIASPLLLPPVMAGVFLSATHWLRAEIGYRVAFSFYWLCSCRCSRALWQARRGSGPFCRIGRLSSAVRIGRPSYCGWLSS